MAVKKLRPIRWYKGIVYLLEQRALPFHEKWVKCDTVEKVAKAIEARDFDRAMSLRDTEFSDFYNSYMTTTTTDIDDAKKVPSEKVRKPSNVS